MKPVVLDNSLKKSQKIPILEEIDRLIIKIYSKELLDRLSYYYANTWINQNSL